MGRAEERRARQRGGHRAASKRRRSEPAAAGKPTKSLLRRMFTWKKILGTVFGVCLLAILGFIGLYMYVDIPEGNAAARQQSNVYKFSDGTLLARSGKVNREIVDLSKVPRKVQLTFVAAENKSFYSDSGVDFKGTARGLLNTLRGRGKQGGSTITQQYVKNYYLNQDQTVTRKLKELVISLKVDREKSKDDILAGYINTSYYGRNAYGIQAAAQAYFGVDAEDLSVEQGAYLAALLQAPSQYDWAVATDTGKRLVTRRWNYVLDNMVEEGWLTKDRRTAMRFPKIKEPKGAPGLDGQKGYLVELANQQLEQQLMAQEGLTQSQAENAVVGKGWTITLNIDRKKQAALEKAVRSELTSKLDKTKRKVDGDIQPGAVSVDPRTGKIVALYGGQNYYEHWTSNATRKDYQPASTFKPVILAAALEREATTQSGKPITADTLYDGGNRRPVVDHGRPVGFAPPNEDEADYDEITVQEAMNKSVNSVFAQMGVDVGMDNVMSTASSLGMDTKGMPAVPAQTLGSMGASPLEMAGIYATFANHGHKVTPTIVKSAENQGRSVDMPDAVGGTVLSRTAADTVTSVLTGVVDDGTAKLSVAANPLRDGQQVAGKTGTSDENKSAWFTGYTPDLVTSVGLFGEDPKSHGHVSMEGATGLLPGRGRINGGGYPAEIWAAYTFGVTDRAAFDLDTTQGAAVAPPPPPTSSAPPTPSTTPSQTPSQTPSETPSHTPSQSPSQTPSRTPSHTPSQTPSQTPTTGLPTEPTTEEPPDPGDDGGGFHLGQ
ncbi:transglycosylase domain-containing protein [Streptomyces eurythermus]|uniref:transglycosylase domain-containing protein n=1 Tax=Streptomyces eurythermus TaxID=42237 RepID=UPI00369A0FCD